MAFATNQLDTIRNACNTFHRTLELLLVVNKLIFKNIELVYEKSGISSTGGGKCQLKPYTTVCFIFI